VKLQIQPYVLVAGLALGCLSAAAFEVSLDAHGDLTLGADGPKAGVRVRRKNWTGTDGGLAHGSTRENPLGEPIDRTTGTARFDVADNRGKFAEGWLSLVGGTGRCACVRAELVACEERDANDINFSFDIPCARLANARMRDGEGRTLSFPAKMGTEVGLYSESTASFEIQNRQDGSFLRFVFPSPCRVSVQDSRRWGPEFTFRIAPLAPYRRPFSPGERSAFAFQIFHSEGIETVLDEPVTIRAGEDWVPIDNRREIEKGSALDFSSFGLIDAPAGKYGRLRAVGDHFEFEKRPGVPQRFYGVNLCFTANTPDAEAGARAVERFRRLGYNSLRLHHFENDLRWGVFTPGGFNRSQLDKFDRLVANAIAGGLYLTTDLYVSRRVTFAQVGMKGTGELNFYAYKALVGLHEGCTEDWKRFTREFLLHVNPYTGRSLAKEPALTHLVLINEGAMNLGWPTLANLTFVKDLWGEWLAQRRRDDPNFAPGLSRDCFGPAFAQNGALQAFMADCDLKAVARLKSFVRELGCEALLSSQNACDCAAMARARQAYDYVDTHHYVDHPRFVRGWSLPSVCKNENPLLTEAVPPSDIAFVRLAGKPFTVSEWNFAGPARSRAAGGLLMGSFAALQDWSALWRFAYAHHARQLEADGDLQLSYFDLSRDPILQANDRTALLLFLRGDMASLKEKLALDVGGATFAADLAPPSNAPDWQDARWRVQVARTLGRAPADWKTCSLSAAKTNVPISAEDSPSVGIDRKRGTFSVVTPRTVGGYAPEGKMKAGVLSFDVGKVPAAVTASSLDGQPIHRSRRILLTHLTDAQAEGRVYANASLRTLCAAGGRTLIRDGRAQIDLALEEAESCQVWGLDTTGRRTGRLSVRIQDGHLVFTASVRAEGMARLYYEIVKPNSRPTRCRGEI